MPLLDNIQYLNFRSNTTLTADHKWNLTFFNIFYQNYAGSWQELSSILEIIGFKNWSNQKMSVNNKRCSLNSIFTHKMYSKLIQQLFDTDLRFHNFITCFVQWPKLYLGIESVTWNPNLEWNLDFMSSLLLEIWSWHKTRLFLMQNLFF